ncbi:MAG TPA: hypothetical protein VF041_03250 [Gemmatimonadaceae bacterium]
MRVLRRTDVTHLAVAITLALGASGASRTAGAQLDAHVSLAAGPTSATSRTIEGTSHGWTGEAALWLSVPHLPVALRLDGSVARFGERRQSSFCLAIVAGPCPYTGYRDETTAGTLSLTTSFHVSRVSPYALVGVGAYRLATTETRYDLPCDPGYACILPATTDLEHHDTTTRFGVSAGAGLAVRVWRAELMTEVRYHSYSWHGHDGHMVPVTFGLRF